MKIKNAKFYDEIKVIMKSPFPVILLIFHNTKTEPRGHFYILVLPIRNNIWNGKSAKKRTTATTKKDSSNKQN